VRRGRAPLRAGWQRNVASAASASRPRAAVRRRPLPPVVPARLSIDQWHKPCTTLTQTRHLPPRRGPERTSGRWFENFSGLPAINVGL